jgi:hypothetical protein
MRVMMLLKANAKTETFPPPTKDPAAAKTMAEMGQLMEDMAKAGVLLGGDGLKPTRFGKRISFTHGKITRWTDGPFAETKECIAGYCLVQVKSWEELKPWIERFAAVEGAGECELRPLFEPTDFSEELLPKEAQERELKMREELAKKAARA